MPRLWLFILVATCASAIGAAPPTTQPRDPAAAAYSEALSRLPESDWNLIQNAVPMDKDGIHLARAQIDKPVADALRRHRQSLQLIREGARLPGCDWSQVRVPEDDRPADHGATAAASAATRPTSRATTQPDDADSNTSASGFILAVLLMLDAQH